MSQAASRKLATVTASRIYAKRRQKLNRTISSRTMINVMSYLSKRYSLLPCFCDHDPMRMIKRRQSLVLSKSTNAFWQRNNKSKGKSPSEKHQRNNSTAFETEQMRSSRSPNFPTLRKSILQRFKRKMPTITARSVIRKRTNIKAIKHENNTDHFSVDLSNTTPMNLTRHDSPHFSYDSNQLLSQDKSYDNHEENDYDTLEPPISSFRTEQQNINATNNTSRTIQNASQTIMNQLNSSTKIKQISATSKRKQSKNISRRTGNSSSKRNTSLSNKKSISTSKHKNPTSSSSITRSKTTTKRMTYGRSPFPNPNLFHSLPRMQNSDEITHDNIHENHLCCKPITSVKGLSTNDQKKLIKHNYLTLISLLPIYLSSQGNFQDKIREKTNISSDGAIELDRLMNEWGSARLFIGASSQNKTLTQII